MVGFAVRIPVLSLRDGVVFPEQRTILSIGRRRSLGALARGGEVLVLAQRTPELDEPGPNDHLSFGCTAELLGATARAEGLDVRLRGLERARVLRLETEDDALVAEAEVVEEEALGYDTSRIRAYAEVVAESTWGCSKRRARRAVGAIQSPGRLADVVIGGAQLSWETRCSLIAEPRSAVRVGRVLSEAATWSYASPEPWWVRLRRLLGGKR